MDVSVSIENIFFACPRSFEEQMKILLVLLEIVIGLALVGTVALSTSSGSTALAAFSGAQALVIIIPLIFVAIILYAAVQHFHRSGGKGGLLIFVRAFETRIGRFVQVFLFRVRLYQRP
jgi:hypothetical protein